MDSGFGVLALIVSGVTVPVVGWLLWQSRRHEEALADCQKEHAECREKTIDLEARLLREQKRTDDLEKMLITGIVYADFDGIIREVNDNFVRLFGWLPEEIEGQQVTELMSPTSRANHEAAWAARQEQFEKDPYSYETHHIREAVARDRSGRAMPVSIELSVVERGGRLMLRAQIKRIRT